MVDCIVAPLGHRERVENHYLLASMSNEGYKGRAPAVAATFVACKQSTSNRCVSTNERVSRVHRSHFVKSHPDYALRTRINVFVLLILQMCVLF